MAKAHSSLEAQQVGSSTRLTLRLDVESKAYLVEAARLRGISVSDYVLLVAVPQAQKEVHAAREKAIALTPEEQLAFWTALSEPPRLTPAQRELGAVMRATPNRNDPVP
jgi:uncharacterized protein (DUF1778 family)